MYMIESWEIETKMYKKEDHFPVNFNTFCSDMPTLLSTLLLYLNFSSTLKLESWLFKNETKVKQNDQTLKRDFSSI